MRKMRACRALQLLISLALLTANCVGQVDWECVPACKCIWVSGKKTAECKRQNLTEIPDALSKEIQHLELTGNLISHLPDRAFARVELVNLQKLILRDCNIRAVHAGAFQGLQIVIEIDLSGNRILKLHRGTFDETRRLRVLLLNQNRLQSLEDELFHDLEFLQKVELSDNHLSQVGEWSFRNLPGLQSLALDGNNLESLDLRSFERLPKLSSLELRKNPWHCDCRLKPFRDWSLQRRLYTRPTACERPAALVGRTWDEVAPEEFACAPRIEALGAALRGEGGPARLWCRASATPRAQLGWLHRQRLLSNGTKRPGSERPYLLQQAGEWANLTIPEPGPADRGEYVCVARNFGGSAERNVSLLLAGEPAAGREAGLALPLALALGLLALLFLLLALTLCLCYCRRRRGRRDEKSAEAASLDQHGLGEQEKSLITAINPVVKPPRRYEAPSVASHGTEMTELNRTLLDNESVFAEGGSVLGVLANGLQEEERGGRATPELEALAALAAGPPMGPPMGPPPTPGLGTLPRAPPYRQYPPDLLAFSAGRTSSPTSQASTAPDSSRLAAQPFGSPASPIYGPIGFKTLPHPARASSATPYSLGYHPPTLPRHGFVTIPRRPRAPSWSSGPTTSPIDREIQEPVYDNLGQRTTADGSSVPSLNKSPEPIGLSMRGRPLPATPTSPSSPLGGVPVPRSLRPTPSLRRQLNRSAPEGAPEWPLEPAEEQPQSPREEDKSAQGSGTLTRKVPPRPPPKPKKKSANGPLYEDEDEDGTEV